MSQLTTRSGKGSALTYGEMDGNFNLLQTRTGDGWFDIVSEFYTRGGPAAPGVSQFIGGVYLLEFSDTDTLEAFANFHIPHSYMRNTMIYPHVHFAVKANGAGTVRWGFEWTFARRHDSTGQIRFNDPIINYIDFVIPANSGYYSGQNPIHFVAEAPQNFGIPGENIEVDGMILSRVFREPTHPNDTFEGSVWAITSDLHIEVDRHSTPNRAPDFYA
jgi:hypothetical protein